MHGGQIKLFDDQPLPAGEHLRMALSEKSWTQDELAVVTGRSRQQINDIVTGRRGITPEMAVVLGAALGTSADYWLKLDAIYQLSQVETDAGVVQKRAKILDVAPIKEMQRRGWIKTTKTLQELEVELRKFFDTDSIYDPPPLPVSARKYLPMDDLTPAQRAWCFRVRQLAKAPPAKPFRRDKLTSAKKTLRRLAAYPSEASRVSEVLSEHGIRFVVIEPLGGAKIDGCAFWLDDDSPVIAVSLRYDRIDCFWFTLMHEYSHIEHGDNGSVDSDLSTKERPPTLMKENIERRADEDAAAALIPPHELESFIRRVGPLYNKSRINQFAHRIKIHPGIIVGQLQHRGEIGYTANRGTLARVRSHVVSTALTDGWDQIISPEND